MTSQTKSANEQWASLGYPTASVKGFLDTEEELCTSEVCLDGLRKEGETEVSCHFSCAVWNPGTSREKGRHLPLPQITRFPGGSEGWEHPPPEVRV